MAKQGFTTADFILYGKVGNAVANQTIVETIGYNSAGDGGIGRWQFTGLTGQTPSQSPADLLDALLNDADGKQWALLFDGWLDPIKLGAVSGVESHPAIQAAANASKFLCLTPGLTYQINKGVQVQDGSKVYAVGAKLLADLTYASAAPDKYMMYNAGHESASVSSETFQIIGGDFDYNGISSADGYHALYIRSLTNPTCDGASFKDGSNGTAFLNNIGGSVRNSQSFRARNCGFDMWDSSSSGSITNCYVDGEGFGAQGIQYTGDATAGTGSSETPNISGNTVKNIRGGAGSVSLIVNALALGSSVKGASVINNTVFDPVIGFALEGSIIDSTLSLNKAYRATSEPYLLVGNASGEPENCRILNNGFIDTTITTAPIKLAGTGHTNKGNWSNKDQAQTYGYAIALASDDTVSTENDIVAGTFGLHNDTGTGNTVGLMQDSGTFTPVLDFGGDTSGFAYSTALGEYSIADNVCSGSIDITLSANGTGAGGLAVSLPFNPTQTSAGVVANYANMQATVNGMSAVITTALGMRMNLLKLAAGGTQSITNADTSNTTSIKIMFSYKIA